MFDVGIIGMGPAGIAASIYLKRAGFNLITFEKERIGGLLLNAHFVENYPGFFEGISGEKLCKSMEKHLEKWNIIPKFQKINEISFENKYFTLKSINHKYPVKAVIIATGTFPKKIDIPGEEESIGKKIFYEVKDLLPIIKPNNTCIVIGGGDAGFDYSLNLAENGVSVDLFFRTDKPKCLALLEKRVKESNNIIIHPLLESLEFIDKNGKIVTIFKSSEMDDDSFDSKEKFSITSDYVLIACGRKPYDDILKENMEKSNIDGFYFAGDVITGKFRQVGIAVGEGISAAIKVESYLGRIKK